MAKIDFDIPDDFMKELLDSDFQDIAESALKESAPELLDSVRSGCQSVIEDKSRTELVNSWKIWKKGVTKASTGAYMLGVASYGKPSEKSTFTSVSSNGKTRRRNVTNNDIAWWLEHGRIGQAAKPFMDRAANNVQSKVLEICQKVFNKKVGAK